MYGIRIRTLVLYRLFPFGRRACAAQAGWRNSGSATSVPSVVSYVFIIMVVFSRDHPCLFIITLTWQIQHGSLLRVEAICQLLQLSTLRMQPLAGEPSMNHALLSINQYWNIFLLGLCFIGLLAGPSQLIMIYYIPST
jgi:hypothetical protein